MVRAGVDADGSANKETGAEAGAVELLDFVGGDTVVGGDGVAGIAGVDGCCGGTS